MFYEIKTFLDNNEILVVSLIVPLLSVGIAYYSSKYSTRKGLENSKSERNLQKQLKLSDYRNDRIVKLSENFANLSSTIGFHKEFGDKTSMREISYYCDSLLLGVDHDDPIYSDLRDMIISVLRHAIDKNSIVPPNLIELGRRIIVKEQKLLDDVLLMADEESSTP